MLLRRDSGKAELPLTQGACPRSRRDADVMLQGGEMSDPL